MARLMDTSSDGIPEEHRLPKLKRRREPIQAVEDPIRSRTTDGFSQLLAEINENFHDTHNMHVVGSAIKEIFQSRDLFWEYSDALMEGLNIKDQENLQRLFNTSRLHALRETGSGPSITPITTLQLPMLRKAWPRLVMNRALPTEAVMAPKFTLAQIQPWIKDGDGNKHDLPEALFDDDLRDKLGRYRIQMPNNAIAVANGGPIRTGSTTTRTASSTLSALNFRYQVADADLSAEKTRLHAESIENIGAGGQDEYYRKNRTLWSLTDDQRRYVLNVHENENKTIKLFGGDIVDLTDADLVSGESVPDEKRYQANEDLTATRMDSMDVDVHIHAAWVRFYDKQGTPTNRLVRIDASNSPEDEWPHKFPIRMDTRTGLIKAEFTGRHGTGSNRTKGTARMYMEFDRQLGTIVATLDGATVTSTDDADYAPVHANESGLTKPKIEAVEIEAYASSEMNRPHSTHQIGIGIRHKELTIPTNDHLVFPIPNEYLMDLMRGYSLDGVAKATEIMSMYMAQKLDIHGINFLDMDEVRREWRLDFNATPPSTYNASPTEWRKEVRAAIDVLASKILNQTFSMFSNGIFVILGNPKDVMLIPDVEWRFRADDEKEGVQVEYSYGLSASGAYRYVILGTPSIKRKWENPDGSAATSSTSGASEVGYLRVLFIPSGPDQLTYKFFPYAFSIMVGQGFVDPDNPSVPAVVSHQRYAFDSFVPAMGLVRVLNHNDPYQG